MPPRLWACNRSFLAAKMQALSTQVHDLGQSAAKMVIDAAKPLL